ncbi:hypothetical protein [Clostridium sp. BJN0001]|uniref:hypothetical protein n=1 Tax=Clostridium sp. BJN0001 TaxID=2930219 RepID=UPI001FD5BE0A|nr:hypothetical protein [Clostridium sp. BJN0001]
MESTDILNEIMLNAKQVPLECQEGILAILKGMEFTKQCLLNRPSQIPDQEKDNKID